MRKYFIDGIQAETRDIIDFEKCARAGCFGKFTVEFIGDIDGDIIINIKTEDGKQ